MKNVNLKVNGVPVTVPEGTRILDAAIKAGFNIPTLCYDKPIWVAEDSVLLSKMIEDSLRKANYVNLHMFPNGLELWEGLSKLSNEGDLTRDVALIITDIEMPQMDGHRLTKLVKESTSRFKEIPLIIFSSLISEEMRLKGKDLGADEQLTKPEIGHLVDVMDHLLVRYEQTHG